MSEGLLSIFAGNSQRLLKGQVIKSTGSWLTVKNEENEEIACKVRGKLRLKGLRTTNPAAVGDWVEYELGKDGTGIISKILPRKNYIIRKSTNLSRQAHILAANVDRLFLLVTLQSPRTSTGFIDRVLCSAEAFHIPVTLLFNKSDLLNEEEKADQEALMELYRTTGYTCLPISTVRGDNLDQVKEWMSDQTNMLAGHSGVGKSSLINAIDPELSLKVSEISELYQTGKHTTTFAQMFPLKFGGNIVDTPGIKGFGVIDINKKELSHYFIEMRELLHECHFNDCQHINEPKCAVKEAVGMGKIAESRYTNYLTIYFDDEESESYRGVDY